MEITYFNIDTAKAKLSNDAFESLNKESDNVTNTFIGKVDKVNSKITSAANQVISDATYLSTLIPNSIAALEELGTTAIEDVSDTVTKIISEALIECADISCVTNIPGTATKYFTKYFPIDTKKLTEELIGNKDLLIKSEELKDQIAKIKKIKEKISKFILKAKNFIKRIIEYYKKTIKYIKLNISNGIKWISEKIASIEKIVYNKIYMFLYGKNLYDDEYINNLNDKISKLDNKNNELVNKLNELIKKYEEYNNINIDELRYNSLDKYNEYHNLPNLIESIKKKIKNNTNIILKYNNKINNKNSKIEAKANKKNKLIEEYNSIKKELSSLMLTGSTLEKAKLVSELISKEYEINRISGIITEIQATKEYYCNQIALNIAIKLNKNAENTTNWILEKSKNLAQTTTAIALMQIRTKVITATLTLISKLGF